MLEWLLITVNATSAISSPVPADRREVIVGLLFISRGRRRRRRRRGRRGCLPSGGASSSRLLPRRRRISGRPRPSTRRWGRCGFSIFSIVCFCVDGFDPGDGNDFMLATGNGYLKIGRVPADHSKGPCVRGRETGLDSTSADKHVGAGVEVLREMHERSPVGRSRRGLKSCDLKSEIGQGCASLTS